MDDLLKYACSLSTTFETRRVKIALPPEAQRERRRRRPTSTKLTPWPRRHPLQLRVVYRGGAESWYEIRARGTVYRVPGYLAIEDVMAWVYAE